MGMGCCYGSQQLPPHFRVYFSGGHTHIRHLKQSKKRNIKEHGMDYRSGNEQWTLGNPSKKYKFVMLHKVLNTSFLCYLLCTSCSYLVNQQSYSCDEAGIRVVSWCSHVCECSQEGDTIRAVHLTQPLLKSHLVLWVCERHSPNILARRSPLHVKLSLSYLRKVQFCF